MVASISLLLACGSGSKPGAAPGGTAEKAPAAAAQASAAAPAPAPAPAPANPAEEVWPATLPAGWKLLNDYEGADPKTDLWGGAVGTWGYHMGRCRIELEREGGSGRQKVTWSLPLGDSQCGTYEFLGGEPAKGGKGVAPKPKAADISGYARVVFLAKSADGQVHKARFELTELDPYDAAQQGYTGEFPFEVGPEWRRYEMDLDKTLHPMFDRRKGKQVGIRIDRKEQPEGGSGALWLDNVTFVAKGS